MYKVFINEKKLIISKYAADVERNMHYEGIPTLEMAVDLLENTSCLELNIYGEDLGGIWEDFTARYKVIEAAGGIVFNSKNQILFIHRLGRWDLPKGKIESGESIDQTALREVEEETSLSELQIKSYINSTFHIYKERSGNHILKITYWFTMTYMGDEAPVPQIEEGITETAWKDIAVIDSEIIPNTFKNIQLILSDAGII